MKFSRFASFFPLLVLIGCTATDPANIPELNKVVYRPPHLKPIDSVPKLKVGGRAPDFTLPAVSGREVSLSQYRGKKNVVISFVPGAFTPICSMQWPGYNIALDMFGKHDAVLIGITTNAIPAMAAWVKIMGGLDFDALSDFSPHGKVSSAYGVLRSEGFPERAMFVIDKQGTIRDIQVYDANKRPTLDDLAASLDKLD